MKKKINFLVFSAGRSDLGLISNILDKLNKDNRFNLFLILGPAHNTKRFGYTFKEVKNIKIKRKFFIKFKYNQSSENKILNYFSETLIKFKDIINRKKVDGCLILGDRYESLAAALVCLNFKIPIIHIGGGSITAGALDDVYRYSISKMAHSHFVETNLHKKNLTDSGFKKNIFVIGAPSLEKYKTNLLTKLQFGKKYKFQFEKNKKILICTFHPETTKSIKENLINLKILINFINLQDDNIIFTYPNADAGYLSYINLIKSKLTKKNNCLLVKNLGRKNYLSALNFGDLLIGNSSSGIIESCSFKIPTIDIGERQLYRIANKNVIHSVFELKQIQKSYRKALSEKFISKIKKYKNIYEKKNTSTKFVNLVYKQLMINK